MIQDAARHYAAGDPVNAAHICRAIIQADPRHFDALHLLGVICAALGHRADSVCYLLRAAALRPHDPRIHFDLGNAFGALQRFGKAEESYRTALTLGNRDAGVLNNLGLTLRGQERLEEAIKCFQSALAIDPWHSSALLNLPRTWAASGHLEEAAGGFQRARALCPAGTPPDQIAGIVNEHARLLMDLGLADDALRLLRDFSAAHPDITSPRWNIALALLTLGRFAEGWPAYEARWQAPGHDRAHRDYRVLDLDRVAGQRVLVEEEQGRGDIIQCLRYIQPLAARGARICLSVHADLLPLARELPEVEWIMEPDMEAAEYDQRTSIMSLPLAFHGTATSIPAGVPYLRPPARRIARMRHMLGSNQKPRVGVAWSGSASSQARAAIPAERLALLFRRTGAAFHCLQKDILSTDQEFLSANRFVTVHRDDLRDFGDTAALIEAMDLVITIDTAVAHLAGALAKPVWIMLPFSPDWRWLLNRDDSPWYPTARLFRQQSPGDWDSVVRAVVAAFPY